MGDNLKQKVDLYKKSVLLYLENLNSFNDTKHVIDKSNSRHSILREIIHLFSNRLLIEQFALVLDL